MYEGELRTALAEVRRLRAENAKLRKVLRPFGLMARGFGAVPEDKVVAKASL